MTAAPTGLVVSIVECTDFEGIKRAAEALRDCAVVVAQTDTNYGVFCNPFSRTACQRLYEMKRREGDKPLTLFVSGPTDWNRWAHAPGTIDVDALTKRFWPGPLNLVMRKKDIVPDWVTSGRDTVSIVHNVSVPVNLLSIYSGLPLAATSANISGTMDQGLVTFEVAVEHVGTDADFAIRGDRDSAFSRSSTIVSLVGEPAILRQGDLAAEELRELLPGLGL